MADTHVNAFKEEAKASFAKVREAVGEAESKFDALCAKLDSDGSMTEDASSTPEDTSSPTSQDEVSPQDDNDSEATSPDPSVK